MDWLNKFKGFFEPDPLEKHVENPQEALAYFLGNMQNFGRPVTTYLDLGWPVGKSEPPNYEEMMLRTKGLQGPSIPGYTDQIFYGDTPMTATDIIDQIDEWNDGIPEAQRLREQKLLEQMIGRYGLEYSA